MAEKTFKKIDYAVWGRVAGVLTDASGEELNDVSTNGVFEVHFFGQVHEFIKFTANFIAGFNSNDTAGVANNGIAGPVTLLDGTIEFEPHESFNVWVGRMLVPIDRSNFSGPWFMAPWNYPGFLQDGAIYAPLEGPNGRNDGATVWGQFGGGTFKYYLGAYDLHDVSQSHLYSGRLGLSLLNPEPGFYNSSTYYGKDILALGVGGQYKRDGSPGLIDPVTGMQITEDDDYAQFNVDLLFEKDLGAAGVFDLEGAFHHFEGDNQAVTDGWFALVSYLIPAQMGWGKLQPLFRVQQAIFDDSLDRDASTMIDAQLGYVIDAYSARLALGYAATFSDGPGADTFNQVFLGAQIQK